jgi:hypothetical protein
MQASTELFLMFERAGFKLARVKKHAVWNCPCGHAQIVSPTTPGKGHARGNAQGEIARTLRTCNQRLRECT